GERRGMRAAGRRGGRSGRRRGLPGPRALRPGAGRGAGTNTGEGGMSERDVIVTEGAPKPFGGAPYNQAIRAAGLVFCAGQVGLDPAEGTLVGGGVEHRPDREDDDLRRRPGRLRRGERRLRLVLHSRPAGPLDGGGGRAPGRRPRRDRGHRPGVTHAAAGPARHDLERARPQARGRARRGDLARGHPRRPRGGSTGWARRAYSGPRWSRPRSPRRGTAAGSRSSDPTITDVSEPIRIGGPGDPLASVWEAARTAADGAPAYAVGGPVRDLL